MSSNDGKTSQPDARKSPDDLTPTGADTGIELTEEALDKVTGGASDIFAKIGDIKGESLDSPQTTTRVVVLTHEPRHGKT